MRTEDLAGLQVHFPCYVHHLADGVRPGMEWTSDDAGPRDATTAGEDAKAESIGVSASVDDQTALADPALPLQENQLYAPSTLAVFAALGFQGSGERRGNLSAPVQMRTVELGNTIPIDVGVLYSQVVQASQYQLRVGRAS